MDAVHQVLDVLDRSLSEVYHLNVVLSISSASQLLSLVQKVKQFSTINFVEGQSQRKSCETRVLNDGENVLACK